MTFRPLDVSPHSWAKRPVSGRNVQGAKRPGGETPSEGAKRPGGRNVLTSKLTRCGRTYRTCLKPTPLVNNATVEVTDISPQKNRILVSRTFCSFRIVNFCNDLPEYLVTADSFNVVKNRLTSTMFSSVSTGDETLRSLQAYSL